jgi:hypothetical protein
MGIASADGIAKARYIIEHERKTLWDRLGIDCLKSALSREKITSAVVKIAHFP